ncbi:hypothetical protein D3C85_1664350 [compost metagenome]
MFEAVNRFSQKRYEIDACKSNIITGNRVANLSLKVLATSRVPSWLMTRYIPFPVRVAAR